MHTKPGKQYYFTLKGVFKRLREEYHYYTKRPWSLSEVGAFWDTVEDYDEVNEQLYTYYRRFTNSYQLIRPYLRKDKYNYLDIQARSGKGSLFWHQKGKLEKAVCVDFSEYLASLADHRLQHTGLSYQSLLVTDLPLPFEDKSFDFVGFYETIEHVYDYKSFTKELSRVLADDGLMILTCPNVLWEWVHWLTAIININHSEGPHRFLRRRVLLKTIKLANLKIIKENSTILLPFNNKISIAINEKLEKMLPEWIKRQFALRRTFILTKPLNYENMVKANDKSVETS
ncbi:MAG: class I SAM-dependent methyltransferase [Bacteroidota bacterium]